MSKIFTNKIFLGAFSLFALIVLMSNSSGRGNIFGQAVTGAPGDSNLTCASAGCHSSGAFSPSADLEVLDGNGNSVTTFTPGETYDITLSVTATGNPNSYGFQMVALLEDESAATDWSEIGSNTQIVTIGSRDYIEHSSPSSSNEFSTKWTAPESGSGDVTFYFSANAVNGNGSPGGDGGTNGQFKLFEMTTSANDLEELTVNVYPNPTSDFLSISGENSTYNYSIFDVKGQNVMQSNFTGETTIDIRNLQSGLYFISLQNNDKFFTKRIIKK